MQMHEVTDLPKFRVQGSAQIHPVVLSGGAGTRLWPVSRAVYPKQFLSLTEERSLLQLTVARSLSDAGYAAPVVICNDEHRFMVEEQVGQIGVEPQGILLEPVPRNTAPAIAAVALWLTQRDPDALMLIQPSDHIIGSVIGLHRAVAQGVAAAQEGHLVTFGIKPNRPETGYGYIQAGAAFNEASGVRVVDRFVEKPDREVAQRFVESGVFYWNSGIFLFEAKRYLEELRRLHPTMLEACSRAVAGAKEDLGFIRLDAEAFGQAPALSIDHAVMEHTDRAVVLPVDMAWNDVGTWQALREASPADQDGNVVHGDVLLHGVQNSYIRSDNGLVAVVGLDNVVVVSTEDAVLVASTDRAGEVSSVVEQLRQRNRPEPNQHKTIYRPWGYYRTVDAGERFQVKRIMVKPGARLSLQKHFHRAEHWVVVQGTALVQNGSESTLVRENESVYVPIGGEHRLENPGKLPLHLIEVQSGAYLGEDDIVRIADNYGRA